MFTCLALASPVVLAAAALLVIDDQAVQIGIVIGAGCLGAIGCLALCRDARSAGWRTLAVLAPLAVIARVLLFPTTPATSPDVHRYLWEGVVQLHGPSPFQHPPASECLSCVASAHPDLAANARQDAIHPHITAIYPPTAQLLFLMNALLFGGTLIGWKAILLLFDAALVATLCATATHARRPFVLLAAIWCPLLIFETYEGAHLDIVGVSLLAGACAAGLGKRPVTAGALLALSINVKYLWPALVGLLLLRELTRADRLRCLAAAAATTALVWARYYSDLPQAFAVSRMFVERWAFNDLPFQALRAGFNEPRWAPMAIVLVALLVGAALLSLRRDRADLWRDGGLLLAVALLLGPVSYPWYFLWLLPFAIMHPRPALWWMIGTAPLLHIVPLREALTGVWQPLDALWWIVMAPAAALLLRDWWLRLSPGGPRPAQPPEPNSPQTVAVAAAGGVGASDA